MLVLLLVLMPIASGKQSRRSARHEQQAQAQAKESDFKAAPSRAGGRTSRSDEGQRQSRCAQGEEQKDRKTEAKEEQRQVRTLRVCAGGGRRALHCSRTLTQHPGTRATQA
ncbi:hypothetical protein V8C26DRAFT_391910 [Trichoderma gracile]